MLRIQPSIEDDEHHSAAKFMHYAESRLIHASEKFRKRYFAIRDAQKREKSETLISTNEPLINEKLTDNLRQFALTEKDNPCNSCNSCSQTRPEAVICDIRDIRVTDKPAAGDISAISALSASQTKVLDCIKAHPGLRVPGLEAETGIPSKSIERHIKVLIERHLIEHRGSKKTGGYHALK